MKLHEMQKGKGFLKKTILSFYRNFYKAIFRNFKFLRETKFLLDIY